MEPSILRGLNDKIYDRRKAAALELEKLVLASDIPRISSIIDQLCSMIRASNAPIHSRTGGLIGLAATAIALGQDVAPFLGTIVPQVMACFNDPESRVRYHACEGLYNIAKVSKGEILVYFNEIFDVLSKLASDSEESVKNGAELLDRLMKDIVSEEAPNYVSIYTGNVNPNLPPRPDAETSSLQAKVAGLSITHGGQVDSGRQQQDGRLGSPRDGVDTRKRTESSPVRSTDERNLHEPPEDKRAFSLARFIPLLSERIYVISPFTRMHMISWLTVLDSVPDLELVAWLPEFLDGLLKYLADKEYDVRLATENVLAEFLREIKYIANVQEKQAESARVERERRSPESRPRRRGSRHTMQSTTDEGDDHAIATDDEHDGPEGTAEYEGTIATIEEEHEWEGEGSGAWVPGQGVYVDHAAIMDIIIQHLAYPDELVQSTAMEWILTFLEFAQSTVVAFTPRIVPAILPSLAAPNRHIKLAAHETNNSLYRVIQSLPLQVVPPNAGSSNNAARPPATASVPPPTATALSTSAASPPSTLTLNASPGPIRKDFVNAASGTDAADSKPINDPLEAAPAKSVAPIATSASASNVSTMKAKAQPIAISSEPVTPSAAEFPATSKGRSRPGSPGGGPPAAAAQAASSTAQGAHTSMPKSPVAETVADDDPFDVLETVNALTLQFLSDHAETRIAALEWLLMLHLKAPTKILSRDSGTFPALLKTLSDPSEDVVKHDLQLLAQISASSEDSYFTSFMVNVLELFSTDRRLLETRGSLIIRQLCLHLNAERIFRTIAEILEKDDDLEFASMMVVKLNMILITSSELADFRRRLRNLDSKDGQMLFSSLYRSWCHNAVAAFALCLLAQAYEHASNLLQIFADLELTVPLLVQIDKLIMLIESPVFTSLRLQLLEPDKYPFLPKCLYGILMILPQSSAFVSLKTRLAVVNSAGYSPYQPRAGSSSATSFSTTSGTTRSKIGGKEEIKWQELLAHFRAVQARHEKARRQLNSIDGPTKSSAHFSSPSQNNTSAPATGRIESSGTIPKSATVKKKTAGRNSLEGVAGSSRIGGMSPLNPKRGGSVASAHSGSVGQASVSIGGAVASMNANVGVVRSFSPPPPKPKRFPLGGGMSLRKPAA